MSAGARLYVVASSTGVVKYEGNPTRQKVSVVPLRKLDHASRAPLPSSWLTLPLLRSCDLFVDQVRIFVKAGSGGNGISSFRREEICAVVAPMEAMGGTAAMSLIASRQLTTLLRPPLSATLSWQRPADMEQGSNRHGKTAADVIIRVPVGTVVLDDESGNQTCDLTEEGQSAVVAAGGRGGRGNSHFATSTNRVPTRFEQGTPGEERWLRLELKLLADVGLVGFPNAGKSTLDCGPFSCSAQNCRLSIYDLDSKLGRRLVGRNPQLRGRRHSRGLVEGAHEGKGLAFSSSATSSGPRLSCISSTWRNGRPTIPWQVSTSCEKNWPRTIRRSTEALRRCRNENGQPGQWRTTRTVTRRLPPASASFFCPSRPSHEKASTP